MGAKVRYDMVRYGGGGMEGTGTVPLGTAVGAGTGAGYGVYGTGVP